MFLRCQWNWGLTKHSSLTWEKLEETQAWMCDKIATAKTLRQNVRNYLSDSDVPQSDIVKMKVSYYLHHICSRHSRVWHICKNIVYCWRWGLFLIYDFLVYRSVKLDYGLLTLFSTVYIIKSTLMFASYFWLVLFWQFDWSYEG